MKKYTIKRLPKAQNGVGNTRITEGDYVFTDRPGSTYRYQNGQWLISNSGTKNKFTAMQDPEGKRAATLTSGLSTGKTQMIGQKPQAAPAPAFNMLTASEPQYQQFKAESAAKRQKEAQATSKWYDEERKKRAELAGIKEVAPVQPADATFVDLEYLAPKVGEFNRQQRILDTFKDQLYNQQEYIRNRGFANTYEYEESPEGLLRDQALAAQAQWQASGAEAPRAPRGEMDFYNLNPNLQRLRGEQEIARDNGYASGANNRYYNTAEGTYDRVTGEFEPAVQYYNASPALQSTDWMFALPILGTEAGIGALYGLGEGAMNVLGAEIPGLGGTGLGIPGLGFPGVTVGNALNAGFIGHGLSELPSTFGSWYDAYQSGTGDYRDAIEKTAWNTLDFLGAGETKEGAKLLAQDVRAIRGAAPTAGRTAKTAAQATRGLFSADDINEIARMYGEQSPQLARAMEINAEAERAAAQRVAPQASTPSPTAPNQLPPPPEEIYIDPAITGTTPVSSSANLDDIRAAYHNSTRQLTREEIEVLANEGVGDPADYFGMGEYNGVPVSQLDPWAFDNYVNESQDIFELNAQAMSGNAAYTARTQGTALPQTATSAQPAGSRLTSTSPTPGTEAINDIRSTYSEGRYAAPENMDIAVNPSTDLYGTGVYGASARPVSTMEEFGNSISEWEAANNLPEDFVLDAFPKGLADPVFVDDLGAFGINATGKTDAEILQELEQLDPRDKERFWTYLTQRSTKVAVSRNAGLPDPASGPNVSGDATRTYLGMDQSNISRTYPQAAPTAPTTPTTPATPSYTYTTQPSGVTQRMDMVYTRGIDRSLEGTAGERLFDSDIISPQLNTITSEAEFNSAIDDFVSSNNLPSDFMQQNLGDAWILDPAFSADLGAFGVDQTRLIDVANQHGSAAAGDYMQRIFNNMSMTDQERFYTYMSQRLPKVAAGRSLGVPEPMLGSGRNVYLDAITQQSGATSTIPQSGQFVTPTQVGPTQTFTPARNTQYTGPVAPTPRNVSLVDLNTSAQVRNASGITAEEITKLDDMLYQERRYSDMAEDAAGTSTNRYGHSGTYSESKYVQDHMAQQFPKTPEELRERIEFIEAQKAKLETAKNSGTLDLNGDMTVKTTLENINRNLEDLYSTEWLRTTYADELAQRGLNPTDIKEAVIYHAGNEKVMAIPPKEAGGKWRIVGNVDYGNFTTNISAFEPSAQVHNPDLLNLIEQNSKLSSSGTRTVTINDISTSAVNYQFHPPPALKANDAPLDFFKVNEAGEMVNQSGEVIKSKSVDANGKTEYYTSDVPDAATKTKPVTVDPSGIEPVAYPIDSNNRWLEAYVANNPNSGLKIVNTPKGKSIVGPAKDITSAELKNFFKNSDLHAETRQSWDSNKIDEFVDQQVAQLSDNFNNKYGEGLYRSVGVGMQKGSGTFFTTHGTHVTTELPNPFRYSIWKDKSLIPPSSNAYFDNIGYSNTIQTAGGLKPSLSRRRAADFMNSQLGKKNAINPDGGRYVFYLKDFGGSIYSNGGEFIRNVYNPDINEDFYYSSYARPIFNEYEEGGQVMYLTPQQIKMYRDAGHIVMEDE